MIYSSQGTVHFTSNVTHCITRLLAESTVHAPDTTFDLLWEIFIALYGAIYINSSLLQQSCNKSSVMKVLMLSF